MSTSILSKGPARLSPVSHLPEVDSTLPLTLAQRGRLHFCAEQYEQAKECFREELIYLRASKAHDDLIYSVRNDLAVTCMELQEYSEARTLLVKTLDHLNRANSSDDLTICVHCNLALCYFYTGYDGEGSRLVKEIYEKRQSNIISPRSTRHFEALLSDKALDAFKLIIPTYDARPQGFVNFSSPRPNLESFRSPVPPVPSSVLQTPTTPLLREQSLHTRTPRPQVSSPVLSSTASPSTSLSRAFSLRTSKAAPEVRRSPSAHLGHMRSQSNSAVEQRPSPGLRGKFPSLWNVNKASQDPLQSALRNRDISNPIPVEDPNMSPDTKIQAVPITTFQPTRPSRLHPTARSMSASTPLRSNPFNPDLFSIKVGTAQVVPVTPTTPATMKPLPLVIGQSSNPGPGQQIISSPDHLPESPVIEALPRTTPARHFRSSSTPGDIPASLIMEETRLTDDGNQSSMSSSAKNVVSYLPVQVYFGDESSKSIESQACLDTSSTYNTISQDVVELVKGVITPVGASQSPSAANVGPNSSTGQLTSIEDNDSNDDSSTTMSFYPYPQPHPHPSIIGQTTLFLKWQLGQRQLTKKITFHVRASEATSHDITFCLALIQQYALLDRIHINATFLLRKQTSRDRARQAHMPGVGSGLGSSGSVSQLRRVDEDKEKERSLLLSQSQNMPQPSPPTDSSGIIDDQNGVGKSFSDRFHRDLTAVQAFGIRTSPLDSPQNP